MNIEILVHIDGAPFCALGDFEEPDLSINFDGRFVAEKIWLEYDPKKTNLVDHLSKSTVSYIENCGFKEGLAATPVRPQHYRREG